MTSKSQLRVRCLTVEQAADVLQLSAKSVRRLIERGDLQVYRFGSSVRVPVEALDAYCNRSLISGSRASRNV